MLRRILVLTVVPFLLAGVLACTDDGPARATPSTPASAPAPTDPRLAAGFNAFGFALLRDQAVREGAGKNVMLSPLSAALALTMAYNGAGGATRAQMAALLGLDQMSLDEANQASAALQQALASADPKVTLAIANSIWARQNFAFAQDFLDRNRQFFGARLDTLDFANPAAKDVINQWVRENTANRIDSIIDRIEPDQVLFLINAVYFKGSWTDAFDSQRTAPRPFRGAAGETQAPMMSRTANFSYVDVGAAQLVSLPYGNGRMAMTVALPPEGAPVEVVLNALATGQWNGWLDKMTSQHGDVALPKFKLEYGATLNDALKSLGMVDAFDPDRADLTGMRREDPRLFVSEVKQQAFIEVNEEGTEAAASTSIGIGVTAARPGFRFVADRPFVFVIHDTQTGAVLFTGVVADLR